jgi:Na+-driven multidrug efflux pump
MASRLDYMLIPTLFGLGTAVLAMVGANTGAGNLGRARRITWIGTLVGASFTGTVGLLAALFPAVWLHLFSRDPAVIASGSLYLQTVAPFYGAVGITFVLGFASQGGGRPVWPFLGGTARMIIAAGLGWIAVSVWGTGLPTLFAIVAASSAVSALICLAAALSGAIWQKGFPSEEAVAVPKAVSVSVES